MNNFHTFIGILLVMILGAFVIAGIFSVPIYFVQRAECKAVSQKMKLEYDYSILTGCMIKMNDEELWSPLSSYRSY